MDVLCLSALLNEVFWKGVLGNHGRKQREKVQHAGKGNSYHGEKVVAVKGRVA